MLYEYRYSITDEVHCYEFTTIPLKLTLTPSYFITPDLDANLSILCIDLVRCGDKGHHKVGETVCHILNKFIDENTHHALGYYPSSADKKEAARLELFNKWVENFANRDDITLYKTKLKLPDENGSKEELIIQVFAHKDYSKSEELLLGLNAYSASVADK